MSDQTPTRPATLTASLHVTPDHVAAHDLPTCGSVSLVLGDDHANVAVLGTIGDLYEVVQAAVQALDAIAVQQLDKADVTR